MLDKLAPTAKTALPRESFFASPLMPHRPRLRFIEGAGEGGGGDERQTDHGFPKDTPVKEMSPEQQAAYHRYHGRKHEERVKAFGDWTPEKIAQLAKERDELKSKTQTADEKAIEDAKAAGRAESAGELSALRLERVNDALERALDGRLPKASALLNLDRNQFIKDGKTDTVAIKNWVEENSDEISGKRPAPRLGQGKTPAVSAGPGERGRAEAERRFNKTKTTTTS